MKENKIDYTKLNEQIVRQAYAGLFTLDKHEKQKLIDAKFERARQYIEALEKSVLKKEGKVEVQVDVDVASRSKK
jgi:isopenicillin N synthase-like dioxygenase